jgi:hypothetical protein
MVYRLFVGSRIQAQEDRRHNCVQPSWDSERSGIAAQKHFASDVVVGGTMGWFIGRYVYDTHMSHLAHKHASMIPLIVPQADPRQRSYGVALVFNAAAGR